VEFTFAVPWTTDRLTEAGRNGLRAAGIAPPRDPADVRCPFCESPRVAMDSAFGPTLCRSLFYCRDCRQPFEAFKPV
jgi:ring-1,2-phenylacetyl-CoA epoxidase subunit PaaD